MSRNEIKMLFRQLPFENITDYDLENEFKSAKARIQQKMNDHRLENFLKKNYLMELFNPFDLNMCKYFDEDEYNGLRRSSKYHLNVFSMNIRSLPKHAGDLVVFLKLLEMEFDVIILTEIGARNISTVENLMEGYDFHYVLPIDNMYEGVGIYLSENITNIQILNDIKICKTCHCPKCNFESLFLNFEFRTYPFTVGGIYRHPNGNTNHFVFDLESTIDQIAGPSTIILAGDINIDIIKFEHDDSMKYLTTLLGKRFLPFITLPTRITDFSATCIDHIFVRTMDKNNMNLNCIVSGIFFNDITDHLPCFLSVKCGTQADKEIRPKTRLFGERNCKKFIELMEGENWQRIYETDADWYFNFISTITDKFERCFPLVNVSRRRLKDKPWVTKGIKNSIKKSHRLYRSSIGNSSQEHITKYKMYKIVLRKCLKFAEESYYHQLFDDTKQSTYNLWKCLGPVINPAKTRKQTSINKIFHQDKYITDTHDIANIMNTYFCEVGKKLQENMPKSGYAYRQYLPDRIESTFYLTPTTTNEILVEIRKLNPRKSCGPDNIGGKIVKLCPDIFAENLSIIYNKSIEVGQYPTLMKIAKVIALFKKRKRFHASNYPPISLLSIFNKIFEKVLCKRLVTFLEKHKIMFEYQYGFRKLYSTSLALIEFTDNIIKYLDEGYYCISVFVDLTKAFDTVDHTILLEKLDQYGIRGHANNFFKSYLSERQQYTVVNGISSSMKKVTCGVPQGSVLGPLFFSLYINDMYRAVGPENIRLFADDTALFMSHSDLHTLVETIKLKVNELCKWCRYNKLIINAEKTNFVLFHTINKPIPNDFTEIKTEYMDIQRVDTFQYLGVTLDETLNWNEHVDKLCKSLLKYFGIFNQIKHKVTTKIARQIYHAFIYSRIKFGIEVYGNCSETNLNRIQTIQNQLLKLILKLDRRTPTNTLHKNMRIVKVSHIAHSSVLGFVNDVRIGRCPEIFLDYYTLKRNAYDLRTKGQLKVPQTRLVLGDKSVKIKGALLWNRMDKSMLKHRFTKSFRKNLIKHFISSY